MIKYKNALKLLGATAIFTGSVAIAINLTDLQLDAEGQKVLSLYGNHELPPGSNNWVTEYKDSVLTLPEEIICLFRQVWKPELVDQGDIHVEINDSKCVGNEDGRSVVQAVFNISNDSTTGKTNGKLWIDDTNSLIYSNRDVTTYMKLSVDSSPTASEPFGRFVLDVVDEDRANTQSPLLVAKVVASGTTFQVTGRTAAITFAGYVDSATKRGIYRIDGQSTVVLGYNDDQICFKKDNSTEDCFPRRLSESLTNPYVKVNAWAYGIYNEDGSRYMTDTSGIPLRFTENNVSKVYELFGGFAGHLRNMDSDPSLYGTRPGGTSAISGSDNEFWSYKSVLMDNQANPSQPIPKKLQWLIKTHSAHPLAAKRINDPSINTNGISLDLTTSVLADPTQLDPSTARSIGALPSAVLNAPLKVSAGTVL